MLGPSVIRMGCFLKALAANFLTIVVLTLGYFCGYFEKTSINKNCTGYFKFHFLVTLVAINCDRAIDCDRR